MKTLLLMTCFLLGLFTKVNAQSAKYVELEAWLVENRTNLIENCKMLKQENSLDNSAFLKELLLDEKKSNRLWSEISKIINKKEVSQIIKNQARDLGNNLLKIKFSARDKNTLIEIINNSNEMSIADVQELVERSILKHKLSKSLGTIIIKNLQYRESGGKGQLSSFKNNQSDQFYQLASMNISKSKINMPTACIVAYCVPLWGALALLVKKCR